MLENKDIMLFLNSIRNANDKIVEIYETKRGNIQMEAYGYANSWRAFLEGRGMPVLEVTEDAMNGESYVIVTFGYPESGYPESELTVESIVSRQRAWQALPEDERPTAAFSFDEFLQIADSYVSLFESEDKS